MNGRIYDPNLGRMLSADPINSNPANLQRYNRFSYVLNNPLAIVDASGFDGCSPTDKGTGPGMANAQVYCMPEQGGSGGGGGTGAGGGGGGGSACMPGDATCPGYSHWGDGCAPGNACANWSFYDSPPSSYIGLPPGGLGGLIDNLNWRVTPPSSYRPLQADGSAVVENHDPADIYRQAAANGNALLGPYVSAYDENNSNYHVYSIGPTEVCDLSTPICSFDFAESIVGSESVPFNLLYSGDGAYELPFGLGLDPIQHRTPEPGVWLNITLPEHRFHPGSVVHGLYESGGHLWIYTLGVGVGSNPQVNTYIGNWVFGSMHMRVQIRMRHLQGYDQIY